MTWRKEHSIPSTFASKSFESQDSTPHVPGKKWNLWRTSHFGQLLSPDHCGELTTQTEFDLISCLRI